MWRPAAGRDGETVPGRLCRGRELLSFHRPGREVSGEASGTQGSPFWSLSAALNYALREQSSPFMSI